MSGDREISTAPTRRWWPRVLAGVLILALLGLWLQRKPIASGYADRWLAAAKVPARYTIGNLGPGRQRLTNVVIGDPAHPDLVADWLETRTAWGWRGPYLAGVRGGHIRARARWKDGRLSFGGIDRLLPAPSGKPFALPALDLDVADARLRIETPFGLLGARLSGQGRLDGGFAGRLAVTSTRLGRPTCSADQPAGVWDVRTLAGTLLRPQALRLEGSGQVARLACAGATTGYANINGPVELRFGDRLTWSTRTDLAATDLRRAGVTARALNGRIEVASGATIAGPIELTATGVTGAGLRAGQVSLAGTVTHDPARQVAWAYTGRLDWSDAQASAAVLRPLIGAGQGTPVGPLLRRIATGLTAAARRFAGEAAIALTTGAQGTIARISRATLTSASGARASYGGGAGATWTPATGLLLDGTARLAGGGLPDIWVQLDHRSRGAFSGTATMQPYAADSARIQLAPVRFAVVDDHWQVTTRATLSGPLGDGRVEALTLPVALAGRGAALAWAGGCAPVSWTTVAVAGLRLDPGGLRLCPTDVAVANGQLRGGLSLAGTRLTGRLATTPLTLVATGGRLRLADRGFALDGVEARLGNPARISRLAVGTLDGRLTSIGLAGRFARAGGQIGAVPLLMSDAAGDWGVAGGALSLTGALAVADTATPARFQPMSARAVSLRLAGNHIDATGTLHEPTTGTQVATVAIRHDLSAGSGTADLRVPALTFAQGFQPELLTRVTFGVIADVRGTVTGEGHIGWGDAGVTSTGRFSTAATDLAAAFGPVTGLAGTIRFTDLLALRSAPGQRVTVRSINPGIPVTDGVVTFQTLPNTRVQVEDARWPFAGGSFVLEPTLLDFSAQAQRRMTFRVTGAAADKFLQQFDLKNLDATGIFDGVLPMLFDTSGGRIEGGHLRVRPGGGGIAYVGPLGQKDIGFWPNLAFQALKSLRYRSLDVVMNGPLAGEMVTEVRFAGVSQGEGAKKGGVAGLVIGRLQRLPFVFNIRIRAPFRGLLDATASFYDPKRLITRNLPQLLEDERKRAAPPVAPTPIQPPASETVP